MNWKFWDKQEKRELQYVTPSFQEALTFNGINNQYSAMNLSAAYRATEIISDSIAMLPIRVKLHNGTHKEELESHSLNLIFSDKSGNTITKFNLMKLLIQSVILRGNGFAYIYRAKDGTVTNIRYVESKDVQIHYNKSKDELYYTISHISNKRIEPINVIHLIKNSYDGINGISVLSYAARSLGISNNTENSANSFFTNGCNLAGVLTVQGQLTQKQKDDIRSSWNQAYSNGGNGLAVLQGNMSYQPIQLNAADSQMLESRQFNVQDIARFFGISPVLLGDLSHSSYSTIEATQNQFLLHTLQPYITMIESEFNRKLLKPSESNLSINLDETALLKTDKTALASYYTSLLNSGVLCVNEVRKELGYSEIEGGDKHLIAYTKIEDNTLNNNNTNTVEDEKDIQE